ncbi:protein-glutamine gamma-glutamyltransferase [Fontibacillus sp. BL9]|uniref:protein-glutamine gamma-glutamyltransferase n=1 Tax=Fontibacillus sp. BL9 TaxID=3389971 RepID=UPI00397C888C
MIILPPGEAEQMGRLRLTGVEQEILRYKQQSPVTYRYGSIGELEFELKTRSAIVEAARALHASGAKFATFKNSRCNEALWIREQNGGFRLRNGVTPAEGIRDIFRNGRAYAFECATAMVIVLYKGVLDSIGEPAFNAYFAGLFLYDWKYDSDLRIISAMEAYPGDVLYFKNPDFNPMTPEWRGENGILLPGGTIFAHGMGIRTPEEIIALLNTRRRPGSMTSAYQTDDIETLDFAYIQRLKTVIARIGSRVYAFGW